MSEYEFDVPEDGTCSFCRVFTLIVCGVDIKQITICRTCARLAGEAFEGLSGRAGDPPFEGDGQSVLADPYDKRGRVR